MPADGDWERARETHARLSEVDVRFRELARHDPELLRGDAGDASREAALLRSPRQPWPLFISKERAGELADAAVAVSQLIRSLPERIFHHDAARMAAFYGRDEAFLRMALQPPNAIAEALSRGDFIDSPAGFQCLELNVGGNLGGLDNCLVARLALATPAIRRFVAALGTPVRHRDTFRLLTRYVIYQALRSGLSNGEVNAALVLSAPAPARAALAAFFVHEYEAVLAEIGPPLRGQLFICGSEGMTIERGALHRFGTRLHAVVEGDTGRLDPMILRCFKAGTLHLYNGPTSGILSDKRNLALLSEGLESDAFTAGEKAAIERHVPWTRRLVSGSGSLEGPERQALARREGLVLKKAWSYGGGDVLLGRETAPEAWGQAVAKALREGDWILQELVESRPYLFQHGDGCRVHRVAWGPYVFGSEYAGMFVRAQAEAEGGVINATHGATSAPLFEVVTGGAAEAAAPPGPPPGSG
jgi:hypothetical protein